MRKSNLALRLQPSLLDEARKLAEAEGVALNQLINVAVVRRCVAGRVARVNVPKASILGRAIAARNASDRRRWSKLTEWLASKA